MIIATGSGSGYRKLGLPNEEELSGRGVSLYATCDGFLFRDRDRAGRREAPVGRRNAYPHGGGRVVP